MGSPPLPSCPRSPPTTGARSPARREERGVRGGMWDGEGEG